MAPRKPKNPIKDLSDAVGGWLGGNRGTINPQVARVSRDLGTVAQTIDTFTGGLGAAAGRDVRNFAQGGSLPTNVAKTAAVNLAAGAVGAKAAQVAGRVVAKTGVPARVVNKLTKQEVLLHGRKTAGYPEIKPMGGKYEGLPDSQRQYAVAWYDNPQVARDFDLAKSYGFSSPEKLGTVYAVRGKAKTFTQGDYVTPAKFKTDLIVQSSKNQKVVGSVNLTGNTGVDDAAIARMLKKAGGTVPASMRKGRGGGAKKR
jgi:hypothetical protein